MTQSDIAKALEDALAEAVAHMNNHVKVPKELCERLLAMVKDHDVVEAPGLVPSRPEDVQTRHDPHFASKAARDVVAERIRQTDKEGWTTDHDDEHTKGELAMAAALYAAPIPLYDVSHSNVLGGPIIHDPWPFTTSEIRTVTPDGITVYRLVPHFDKRGKHPRRRELVIAGAMIIAEIERLDRAGIGSGPRDTMPNPNLMTPVFT